MPGEHQERAEHVQDPVEPVDEGHAGEDEHQPQHQRAEDAPEQHPVLVLARHDEVAEDQRPHEDVVDAEALLDQVAGVVLARRLAAVDRPDDQPEGEADADPDGRLDGGLLRA